MKNTENTNENTPSTAKKTPWFSRSILQRRALTIHCAPEGTIWADGIELGPTGETFFLKKGHHALKITAATYEDWQDNSFQLSDDQELSITLKPAKRALVLCCNVDATMLIDLKDTKPLKEGQNPIQLPWGKHSLQISSEGCGDYHVFAQIPAEGPVPEIHVELEKLRRSLITQCPVKGDLYVDNSKDSVSISAGETEFRLPWGKHQLRFVAPGYQEWRGIICIPITGPAQNFMILPKKTEFPLRFNSARAGVIVIDHEQPRQLLQGPNVMNLSWGEHTMKFLIKGYDEWTGSFEIDMDGSLKKAMPPVQLMPKKFMLTLNVPNTCDMTIDGSAIVRLRSGENRFPFYWGKHAVTLKSEGFEDWSGEFELGPDGVLLTPLPPVQFTPRQLPLQQNQATFQQQEPLSAETSPDETE